MAAIRTYPFICRARVEASSVLAVYRNGTLVRSGRGLAVWFVPHGSTSLVEVPADDRDHVIAVSAVTRDFQAISVQGLATWRAVDPMRLAERVDFSVDPRTGVYRSKPVAQIEAAIDGLVKTAIERTVTARTVAEVLEGGVGELLSAVEAEVAATSRLESIGIGLAGLQLSDLTPSPDLVRALRQPTVERLQQAADEATFGRRAAAVEKEAAIAENETRARIRLEEERAKLLAKERENELAKARTSVETARITAEGNADNERVAARAAAASHQIAAEAEALSTAKLDEVRLRSERERAEIARSLPQAVVVADALKNGLSAARIGTLNLGPDVMTQISAALTGNAAPAVRPAPASPPSAPPAEPPADEA